MSTTILQSAEKIPIEEVEHQLEIAIINGYNEDYIRSLFLEMHYAKEDNDIIAYTKAVSLLPPNLQEIFSNAS